MCLTVKLYNVASQFTDHNLEECTNSMPFSHTVYKQEVARVVGHVRRFLRFAVSKDVVPSLSNAFSFNHA